MNCSEGDREEWWMEKTTLAAAKAILRDYQAGKPIVASEGWVVNLASALVRSEGSEARDVLEWICRQSHLFFAECSQAEEILARCTVALAGKTAASEPEASARTSPPTGAWRDISSAPKDRVVLVKAGGFAYVARNGTWGWCTGTSRNLLPYQPTGWMEIPHIEEAPKWTGGGRYA